MLSHPFCSEWICDHAMLFCQIYVLINSHCGSSRGMLSDDVGWWPGSRTFFSLLCFLQYSSSLVLRGTLPRFIDCSDKGCDERHHHVRQTSNDDGAGGGVREDGSPRCAISRRCRARWDAGVPNPDLYQTRRRPESFPLPPCARCRGNHYNSNNRYRPEEGKGTEWVRRPTSRDILVGQQSSSNVSHSQQLHYISWIPTAFS